MNAGSPLVVNAAPLELNSTPITVIFC